VRGAPVLTDDEVREAVQDALDSLPESFASRLTNVAVIVEDRHPSGRLLGLFDPRGGLQRIIIYRELHPSAEQVKRTVLHEVGHYFGMNESQIRGLGY
jgi:predicted Zn-dependent protease with MMP-like domain